MKNSLNHLLNYWPFLLGLALGLYFITLNITGHNFSDFPGDLGDGRFNNYILEHCHQYFTGQVSAFWNAGFMVPEANMITYSDNLLGSAPFYSVFRMAGFDRETAYQCWYVLLVILNYGFCYLFLRKLTHNTYAAVLGAMVFAFSMALQGQAAHAQTFPRFAIPLAFLMAVMFMEELRPRYFFLAVLFAVYQVYCAIYLGLMLVVPLAVMLLTILALRWRLLLVKLRSLRWIALMTSSLLVNVLLLLPLMQPYHQRGNMLGYNLYPAIFPNLPGLKSYFFSMKGSFAWDFLEGTDLAHPAWWDHLLFAGGIATLALAAFWIVMLIKLFYRKACPGISLDNNAKVLFLTGLACFLLFLRIGNFSLYQYIFQLPGFGSMRALGRIINVELLFYAFALSFLFHHVTKKKNWQSALLFVVFACMITADNYITNGYPTGTGKAVSQARVNRLVMKMKKIPAGALVSYEPLQFDARTWEWHLDAMLAAQQCHLLTVNGYTGTCPAGYGKFWLEMNAAGREEWFKFKGLRPDTVYVVH